ncbi:ABC-type branched-chain amino acid transport system, substrate-binding protein [Paenimyroides ummariense]|uniref:ABC-type branched-chain amino acid transport system, substrate-binding protein n=1 Tax=Paenimyroides ummariense TaxID=913024 RepID=A0A1I4XW47_9FLAO|nr:LysM peptidoglycan-binding domain-containing protein [Paenimyroides ummariense]SFN30078.1 ABC-type branched-chain amino acid transport system, substrate-binding protein [Paenimyroides ummariense]
MKRLFFTLSTLFCATVSFAQTATKTHTVTKGETITQIAKRYNTTNNVLFLLNPEAVDGVSENQIIKIPTTSSVQHQVQAKETVYGISKQYNIAIEKLYDLNPGLKENGLKIGQFLNLAETTSKNTTAVSNNNQPIKNVASTTVIVEKGETIYGIAVKNNTTVSVLYELNPGLLESGLKVGQPINIPVTGEVKTQTTDTSKKTKPKTIVVQPKQTIYNIAKTNNVSQEQLMEWNPDLKNGLKDGSTLIVGYSYEKVPFNDNSAPKPIENTSTSVKKGIDLSLSNDGSTRDLVLLLPFNIANNNFNNPSINQSIKEDVFLNMTLDFYSGAKLAIEDLKSKNYNLNIKFVDSKETNRALDVNTLKGDFDFSATDVIIGPFFQKNVDAVSEAFKNQQTIIVSPLSTEKGKPFPRQVHTMPNTEIVKKEMLEYVISKQERVVAITDGKKTSSQYFSTNYPAITTLSVTTDEKVSPTVLKNLLSETETNYIVYDATSLTTTVELINTLKSLQKEFKIQLVSLEKLDVLESSDVEMNDLIALKYTFPSVTNDASSNKKEKFVKEYKTVYGKNPSRFATRGYDVTYDIITRMFESDENSNIFDYGSQQIENKFAYINENGGVYNNAVYILQYDKDLTIKEAK